jgi:anti-sigma factor RsiW
MSSDPTAGRVVRLGPPSHGDAHDEAQRLLPWLLTGRLDDAERAMVQAHLAACPRCQGELGWERRLQACYAELQADADTERGLAAMHQRLQRPPRRGGWPAGRAWARRLQAAWRAAWRAPAAGLRGVLALQAAMILLLAAGLFAALQPREAPYRALGAAATPAHANAVVRFRPEATDLAVRQALQGSGARVVDGPTVSGAYLLRLPAVERDNALKRLRGDSAVLLAESLE